MTWNPLYRKLGPKDSIDRSKGDQIQDTGNGYWILAYPDRAGSRPIPGETWRRPIKLRSEDLHEHTAPFST